MLGVIPFGLAYGVMSSQAKLAVAETSFMSLIVFAGAAQFMAAGMLQGGVSSAIIVLSTLLINLRTCLWVYRFRSISRRKNRSGGICSHSG
ncbi:MAG TPA: AzlC family ABC transporter permease [Candidatus Aquicultor sp.]|jgi:predicted branched-subunit amino acid permease